MKAHPLTKIQFWIAVIWGVSTFLVLSIKASELNSMFFFSMVLFIGLSIVTFYIGWLMVVKKTDVVYPFQSLGIRFVEKTRGKQAAQNLVIKYSQPRWKMTIGIMNILAGLLCFAIAVISIVAILRAL